MKIILAKIAIQDGENEYYERSMFHADVGNIGKALDEMLMEQYGTKDGGEIPDDYRIIRLHSHREINQHVYDILKTYL